VRHVRIGQQADLVVVAPATADLLARPRTAWPNDLLTNVLLTARCPVVMAPADAHRDVAACRDPGQRRAAARPAAST
jgi:phosphopantothenoylcysteine synthetase/decarboxylase